MVRIPFNKYSYKYINRLRGSDPYCYLDELECMQYWEYNKLKQWVHEKLIEQLWHAYHNTSYYKRTLDQIGLRIEDVSRRNIFHMCPILTKDLLRHNYDTLQSHDKRRSVRKSSTSGSTGKPVYILRDNECRARELAGKMRAYRWYGCDIYDRNACLAGGTFSSTQRVLLKIWDTMIQRDRLVCYDLSEQALKKMYETIKYKRSIVVSGYPSAIHELSKYCLTRGVDLRDAGVRLVVPTAEMLYDYQRKDIESCFGAPVMNEYGCIEVQYVGYECPEGNIHINHENVNLEITDENGVPLPNGDIGYVTLTPLHAKAMPLIRYQNGDLASLSKVPCGCGRHSGMPYLANIQGRSQDKLFRCDGVPMHPSMFTYAARTALNPGCVSKYQGVQKSLREMELKIVRGEQFEEGQVRRFADILKGMLGADMLINICYVDSIPREHSGKFRYFISCL